MNNPRFDLVDIVQTLRSKRKLLLIAILVSAAIGGLFYVAGKKKYKAEADFIITNPLYADRNNLYRTRDTRFIDYFGGDDDLDRVLVIATSDTLREVVADKLNLWDAYKLKKADPKDRMKMKEIFKDNFKMERTEYTTGKVYFKDTDADRSAAVVNLAIKYSEEIFRGYYLTMKNNIANSVVQSNVQIDTKIAELLKQEAEVRSAGMDGSMAAVKMSEIALLQQSLLQNKATNMSVLNELLTGADANDRSRYLQVITPATPPAKPAGIGLMFTVLGAAFFGFFFVAIYTLLVTYYRLIINTER